MATPVENIFIPPHIPGERMVNFLQDAKRKVFAGMPCTRELMITAAGYHPHAEGHHCVRPRGSRGFVFLYCIDGAGWAKYDATGGSGWGKKERREITLSRNRSVFLRPGLFHEYGASKEEPWSYYYIHYEGTLAAEYTRLILEQDESGTHMIQESEEYLRDFCLILENLEKGWNYPQMVMASACLHKLLSYIYVRKKESADEVQVTSARSRVQAVAEMIEENPQNQLSVLELARAANLSVSRFNELFKAEIGESPKQYALQMKIEKSKELLARSDLCIYEISDRVGFEDCHYFSRIFSRKTGMTPSEFRTRHGDTVPGPASADSVET